MQIIIPMSGFGERFRRAGYSIPKPLIEIENRPLIAHVIDLFPGEQEFIFICNEDHLADDNYQMAATLSRYCPTGKIIGIPSHKLGPVHAVCQVKAEIDLTRPVIVNYCDFTCYWDWPHFKTFVKQQACIGAIPAYRGFHPHTLGQTNYAYMQESAGWLTDIQEKRPFTDNRMDEYASSGTYYFASGKIMLDAFHKTVAQQLTVNGEYYVSLAYKPLLAQKQPVAVYPLQHFMQWGTPEDVTEYRYWSNTFKHLLRHDNSRSVSSGSLIMPMAGLGKRFADEGYEVPKPLIPVSGKSMVVQAVEDLPKASEQVFVLRADMPGCHAISEQLKILYPSCLIKTLPKVTEGQACTALIGLEALERKYPKATLPTPLTFGACDNGVLYDSEKFQQIINNPAIDIIVWAVRGYPNAQRLPNMYGWIDADETGQIKHISVKTSLGSPATDPIVTGTFTFKRAEDFRCSVDDMIINNERINGEYYLDACINNAIKRGLRCYLFEVDSYLAWGTPNELKTFDYWQSCFHKWQGHPYRLEHDQRVAPQALPQLIANATQPLADLKVEN